MNTKFYFISALASMALLSGCSDNELASVETSQKTPIGFHTVGSQMGSRATIITPSNLQDTDFKVYAFTDKGEEFLGTKDTDYGTNGIHIHHNGTKWDYKTPTDLSYWPGTVTPLNFFAVNPATFDSDLAMNYTWKINDKEQKIRYWCVDEYGGGTGKNIDVMYAIANNQTKNTNSGTVKMKFRHILSQIAFQAKTQDATIEVEIEDIKLFNLGMSGHFTFPENDQKQPTKANWEPTDIASGAAFNVIKGAKASVTNAAITKITNDETNTKTMLVIPQKLKAWQTSAASPKTKADADNDKESYLGINCKIKLNGKYVNGSKDEYEFLYVPFKAEWEPGKRYVYTLIFGGGYTDKGIPVMNPVNFDAEVTDWVEDENNTTTGNDVITQQ